MLLNIPVAWEGLEGERVRGEFYAPTLSIRMTFMSRPPGMGSAPWRVPRTDIQTNLVTRNDQILANWQN